MSGRFFPILWDLSSQCCFFAVLSSAFHFDRIPFFSSCSYIWSHLKSLVHKHILKGFSPIVLFFMPCINVLVDFTVWDGSVLIFYIWVYICPCNFPRKIFIIQGKFLVSLLRMFLCKLVSFSRFSFFLFRLHYKYNIFSFPFHSLISLPNILQIWPIFHNCYGILTFIHRDIYLYLFLNITYSVCIMALVYLYVCFQGWQFGAGQLVCSSLGKSHPFCSQLSSVACSSLYSVVKFDNSFFNSFLRFLPRKPVLGYYCVEFELLKGKTFRIKVSIPTTIMFLTFKWVI